MSVLVTLVGALVTTWFILVPAGYVLWSWAKAWWGTWERP